ncbi:MAG: carbohydrate-binding protein [Reichenbachiella sp.]
MKLNCITVFNSINRGKILLLSGLIIACFSNLSYSQMFVESESFASMSGVQTQGTSDEGGGINIGYIDNGDWMTYSIDIPVAGDYKISFRTASENGGGVMKLTSSRNSLTDLNVPSTGGWQIWQTITSESLSLSKGSHTLKVTATTGGFNLNWMEIKLVSPSDNFAPTTPVIGQHNADEHNIDLSWSASTDEGSVVVGYKIYNSGVFLAFSEETSFSLSKLAPETAFELAIHAIDLAGNSSEAAFLSTATTALNLELIWSDEFDGTTVDREKWNFSVGPNNANNEEQYYTDGNNSNIVDGKLTIEAKIEEKEGWEYTSSKLTTIGKGDWTYGRIEVSAKMPDAGGTWPAIWMMPTNSAYGGWPNSGEIDVLEHVGNNLGWAFGTVHTGAYNHILGTQSGGGMTIEDIHQTFHKYIIEWYPDRIDFYFDDLHYFTFHNDYKTSAEWPYDQSFYLILNIAVGGDLGGTVHPEDTWPSVMEVDYVRVYDFNLGAEDTTAPSTPTDLTATSTGIDVTLRWTQSTDDQYVKKYNIYQNDVLLSSSASGGKITISGLDPETEYSFGVQAIDFGENVSETVNVTISTTEVTSQIIPGVVQAEDFLYMEGVQTENTEDVGGGINVGWIDTDDWMEYSIDVQTAGQYFLSARVAAQAAEGSLQLIDKDDNILTTIAVPVTGGWQSWASVESSAFDLEAGVQRVVLKALSSGFNLNSFELSNEFSGILTSTKEYGNQWMRLYPNPMNRKRLIIDQLGTSEFVKVTVRNIQGKKIYSQQFTDVKKKISINNLHLNAGIYIVNVSTDTESKSIKLTVK